MEITGNLLAILGFAIWVFALGAIVVGTFVTFRKLRTPPPHLDAPFALFPISILKPVKGIDPGLEENLESFFGLDYPDYELLFCVADERDPACRLVRRILARHPEARARLLVGESQIGPNPKVNNIFRAYREAAHDLLLVSDSNIRATSDYLRRQVGMLDAGVGMVTSLVCGSAASGIGGGLEATFLNTFYTRWMCLAEFLGRPCVLGKSMLFRRSDAERFGGLRVLSRFLAEDYMAGESMRRLGLRVVVAADPVRQVIGWRGTREFWSRHLRWGRIRKSQSIIAFVLEPTGGAMLSGLFGALAAAHLFGWGPSHFILFHLLLWSLCDFALIRRLGGEIGVLSPLDWFLRELSAVPLWLHIACGSEIEWRGRRLRLLSGGVLAKPLETGQPVGHGSASRAELAPLR